MIKAGQESDTHFQSDTDFLLSAESFFSQQAGTNVKNKRFILEFRLYLQVVLTIISKPVQDVAFLKYEILRVIILSVTVFAQYSEEDTATSSIH